MGIEQYKVGKSWEEEVLEYYQSNGFSTFKLPTDIDGTVFDILAIKNNIATCIECKHTKTDKLSYKTCGLEHKEEELDNFVSNGNSVLIYVKSDKTGTFIIDWLRCKQIMKEKGHIKKEDCVEIII